MADIILPYNRRYVVINEREVIDTQFTSLTEYNLKKRSAQWVEDMHMLCVITRYPSQEAAREAELALNGLEEQHGN